MKNKTQKIFAMLKIFREHKAVTVPRIAELLNVSQRTVHRYIKELRKAGYEFETKTGQRGYTEMKMKEPGP